MKFKYILPAVLGVMASAALTGCYEMDTLPLNQYITEDQKTDAKEANPEMAQASITGITGIFSAYGKVLEAMSGQETHSDFGFPAIMLGSDCRGIDMVSDNIGYNWFRSWTVMNDCKVTSDGPELLWGNCYKQIFAANAALKSINPETEDGTLQFYMAQAKAMRAYDYFLLAQNFQFTYKGNETKPCVMLITEENEEEAAANGCKRSTVEEIYGQIMADLDSSIELLESCGLTPEKVLESKPKRFISLAAAYGLRARVNLVMNNWDAAAEDAGDAIKKFKGAPISATVAAAPGFASIDEPNWMWGIAIATTDRCVTTGICNWPSHLGSLNYGYASVGAWRKVNKALFEWIPETDVRRGWFLDGEGVSKNLTEAQQEYCINKKIPAYAQVKFAPYQNVLGQSENANDVPLMRVEEMYLIKAEAEAMGTAGPAAGTQTLVNFIKAYRNPAYAFAGGSPEDVQNEVWMHRRVELYGEGLTTLDLLRLNKPWDRRGGGWPQTLCYDVPAGSAVLIYPIPESELNGNKAFNETENNPSAPMPEAVQDFE